MVEYDLGLVVGSKGDKGDKGDTGNTGNGIASIELLSTSGKNKTYRITYTNGNHFDFTVTDGDDGEGNIVTSWSSTLSDTNVPSEKLTKNTIDTKISKSNTSGLVKNDGSIDTNTYLTSSSLSNYMQKSSTSGLMKNDGSVDTNTYLTISSLSNYMQKSSTAGLMKNDGTVDTNTYLTSSSLSNYVQKSSTSGLIKNDGTIDTTSYSTFSGAYSDLTGKPTIPSASSTTPSADVSGGAIGSGTTWAKADHQHPLSTAYATAGHTHTGMLTSSDIADNLTTNDSTKVLSAKQGKVLKDLIGDAITYINQQEGIMND